MHITDNTLDPAQQAWDGLNKMREMMRMMRAQLDDLHEMVQQQEQAMRELLARARVGDDEPTC